jgi:acyl carrier protein
MRSQAYRPFASVNNLSQVLTDMDDLSSLEREVAELLVTTLDLLDTAPEDIEPEQPLFGNGLGLDSLDALELGLAISKKYGFQLRSDDANNAQIFASLRSLSQHIDRHRVRQ